MCDAPHGSACSLVSDRGSRQLDDRYWISSLDLFPGAEERPVVLSVGHSKLISPGARSRLCGGLRNGRPRQGTFPSSPDTRVLLGDDLCPPP